MLEFKALDLKSTALMAGEIVSNMVMKFSQPTPFG
jgi:hypothetical protein